jgi:hypothetical protein
VGQKSAIDKMPKKFRDKLIEMLNDPAITQAQIVEAINSEAGDKLLSTSSMNRYAQKMKRFTEKNRQAREVAEAYLERCGADSRNKMGKVINEQIRLAAYDLMLEIDEIKERPEVDAGMLTDILLKVSKSLREIEQAEKLNAERTETIRNETLAEVAEVVERETKKAGLDASKVEIIKKEILGI